jgi:hypothetical protein
MIEVVDLSWRLSPEPTVEHQQADSVHPAELGDPGAQVRSDQGMLGSGSDLLREG